MRAVVRIDHRRLWIVSHAAGAEKMHGELLLPSWETPLFLRAGGLEVLAPARRSRRQAAESKTDGREIEPRIQPTPAVEPDFSRIEFVEIVQHSADGETFVVVERMLELADDHATAVEHQVSSDDAAGVREAVGK